MSDPSPIIDVNPVAAQRRREKRKPVGQRHVPRAIVQEGRRAGRR
ncbi:MAG: hypothetical protein ACLTMP_09290 [Eggerthella lenta]